jgi:hypothetical protein
MLSLLCFRPYPWMRFALQEVGQAETARKAPVRTGTRCAQQWTLFYVDDSVAELAWDAWDGDNSVHRVPIDIATFAPANSGPVFFAVHGMKEDQHDGVRVIVTPFLADGGIRMHDGTSVLLVFEDELEDLRKTLQDNVIRTANSRQCPHNPLRPNKEITFDATGEFVLPNSRTGISLAASIRQLTRIMAPGMRKWLLAVDRNLPIPEGLRMQADSPDHWSIVVTRKMSRTEFDTRVNELIKRWKVMGRYVRYE